MKKNKEVAFKIFRQKYGYILVALPIYFLYFFLVPFVLGVTYDIWDDLVKWAKKKKHL